jgi:hypothetical protein
MLWGFLEVFILVVIVGWVVWMINPPKNKP